MRAKTFELLRLHIPRKAEATQDKDSIPVQVDFVPGHAVTSRLRKGVMVVVPALTKRQQCHPKAVPGVIASAKAPFPPHMRGGVDQPSRVQPDYRTKEDAPQNVSPSAHRKQQTSQYRDRHPVPPIDPALETVFAQFGHVGEKLC